MQGKSIDCLIVRKKPGRDPAAGLLCFGHHVIECRLGKNGITARKTEGDHCTPHGRFSLLYLYYRKDRVIFPKTDLLTHPIHDEDGWCDDPQHANYNRAIKRPFSASHEQMKRTDQLYDICIVLDFNIRPRTKGKGSAIFFHLTSPDARGTAGCVAIQPDVMKKMLPRLSKAAVMKVVI